MIHVSSIREQGQTLQPEFKKANQRVNIVAVKKRVGLFLRMRTV